MPHGVCSNAYCFDLELFHRIRYECRRSFSKCYASRANYSMELYHWRHRWASFVAETVAMRARTCLSVLEKLSWGRNHFLFAATKLNGIAILPVVCVCRPCISHCSATDSYCTWIWKVDSSTTTPHQDFDRELEEVMTTRFLLRDTVLYDMINFDGPKLTVPLNI